MGYIYKDNNLIGSIDEKGKIYKNNVFVGSANEGLVYNQYSLLIGSYRDNQVYDINKVCIGNVNAKGIVYQNSQIVGDVASNDDYNQAASALLLLLAYTPAYTFINNIIDDNNIFLLNDLSNSFGNKINDCLSMLQETQLDDSNPIHFKKISKRIDIFMDAKWEEFLSIAVTSNDIFTRLLKVYPDLLKHLAKQFEFEKDNHYLNFTMAILAYNGQYVEKNITFAIQTLFKSAKESYELAIKYCQQLFSSTNLIDNLNYPLQSIYSIQLSKQEIFEMIEYLEKTFSIKTTTLPTTKISIRNKYQPDDIDGLAVDKITRVNDILYSDCWLNIIACLSYNDQELANTLFTLASSLPEGIYNFIKIDNTNNPYILYLYGIMNIIGLKTKMDKELGLKYIKLSADLGYELAIEYLKKEGINLANAINIQNNRDAIFGLKDEIINYLKNNVSDSNKIVNLYTSNQENVVVKNTVSQKTTGAKAKNKKKSKVALVLIFIVILLAIAALFFLY